MQSSFFLRSEAKMPAAASPARVLLCGTTIVGFLVQPRPFRLGSVPFLTYPTPVNNTQLQRNFNFNVTPTLMKSQLE